MTKNSPLITQGSITTIKPHPHVEIIQVSPEQASEWLLTRNSRNRAMRHNDIARYARDMQAGRWLFTGEGIKFDWDGVLLDGQNRLQAIFNTGITVPLAVFTNLDPTAQEVMDSGRGRKVKDQFDLRGEKNATALAAIVRRGVMWEAGYVDRRGGYIPSFAEQFAYLVQHPGVYLSADVAGRLRRHLNMTPSVVGLGHHLIHSIDAYGTESFIEKLIYKTGMVAGDPAAALLRTLGTGPGKPPEADQLGYFIKAWNLTREGKTVGRLQAPRGGWTADNFPRPV